jgi:hypothetical protein
MGRPRMDKDKVRARVSISVLPAVKELAEGTGNASKLFETSVLACKGISEVLRELGDGPIKKEKMLAAFEDIEDLVAVWERVGDETIPLERVVASLGKAKKVRKARAG